MPILCRSSFLISLFGRRFTLCKVVVALIVLSLTGQAIAHPCDISGDTIDGRCSMFTKTLEVLDKRFEATLEASPSFPFGKKYFHLSFGKKCEFTAMVWKEMGDNYSDIYVKPKRYNNPVKIQITEDGVYLDDGNKKAPIPVCRSLEFEHYENFYRLPFSWSTNYTTPDVTLKFKTIVKFIDPVNNNRPSLSRGALIGISLVIFIVIIFVPVGIFIYCMCKRRRNDKPNPTEVKPVETPKQQHKDSKKQNHDKTAKSVEETVSFKTLTPANSADQHNDKKHLKPERASKKVSKLDANARQVEHAKSNEAQKKHDSLNEKSRQAACGCQHRNGKLCDKCKTAISKANQASVSLTESQATKTVHD